MRPSGQSTINLFSVYQSTVNVNPHSSFVLYNMLFVNSLVSTCFSVCFYMPGEAGTVLANLVTFRTLKCWYF